jgi:hypothetical protein
MTCVRNAHHRFLALISLKLHFVAMSSSIFIPYFLFFALTISEMPEKERTLKKNVFSVALISNQWKESIDNHKHDDLIDIMQQIEGYP